MDNSLGCAGRAARVQDKERVLGVHHFGRAIVVNICHHFVKVELHLAVEFDRDALFPAQDNEVLDCGGIDNCLFYHVL